MGRIPGTSKEQDVAKGRRRCFGCGKAKPLVYVTGTVYACRSCRAALLKAWEAAR